MILCFFTTFVATGRKSDSLVNRSPPIRYYLEMSEQPAEKGMWREPELTSVIARLAGVQVGLDERTRSARTVFRRKLPEQSIKTVQAFADAAYYKPTKSILEML